MDNVHRNVTFFHWWLPLVRQIWWSWRGWRQGWWGWWPCSVVWWCLHQSWSSQTHLLLQSLLHYTATAEKWKDENIFNLVKQFLNTYEKNIRFFWQLNFLQALHLKSSSLACCRVGIRDICHIPRNNCLCVPIFSSNFLHWRGDCLNHNDIDKGLFLLRKVNEEGVQDLSFSL